VVLLFGDRLKQLREEKQLSQIELAKLLHIANTTLSMYETGNREPDYDTLKLLASELDCSTDYLLGLTNIRKYYTVIASKFVDQLPEGELKEFVKKYGDEILLDLARKINNYKLDPQDLADLIDMLGRIQAAKEKK
jgi:transcriptional regulator with XRE-family HTH domain